MVGMDMWQMKSGSGLEPASPREPDYRDGAPTTRLWPGPFLFYLESQLDFIDLSMVSKSTGKDMMKLSCNSEVIWKQLRSNLDAI